MKSEEEKGEPVTAAKFERQTTEILARSQRIKTEKPSIKIEIDDHGNQNDSLLIPETLESNNLNMTQDHDGAPNESENEPSSAGLQPQIHRLKAVQHIDMMSDNSSNYVGSHQNKGLSIMSQSNANDTSMMSLSMVSFDAGDDDSSQSDQSDHSTTQVRKLNNRKDFNIHIAQKPAPTQLTQLEEVFDEEESGTIQP